MTFEIQGWGKIFLPGLQFVTLKYLTGAGRGIHATFCQLFCRALRLRGPAFGRGTELTQPGAHILAEKWASGTIKLER